MPSIFPYSRTIVAAAVLFLAIILCLAVPPKRTKKVLGIIAVLAVIAALGLYGYGYQAAYQEDAHAVSNILRTVFDSCRIFVGANNWSEVKVVYGTKPLWEFVFWLVHLLAMITSASAVIVSLGSRLLKKIRIRLFRMRDITLIYGLSENTLDFGLELVEKEKAAVLYVDHGARSELHAAVEQMGALVRSDGDALEGNLRFLKSIGLKKGKRKLRVYALDGSMIANQQFAGRLMNALEKQGILPEQTALTILSAGNETDNPLQAVHGRYGYGSLISINEPEMVARILVRNYPPCRSLTFDGNGRAESDFHGLVIGFGRIGQAVLRQLVMNSQFQGSGCRIAVFAPDYEQRMGWLAHECRDMLAHYNIRLFPYDGRSRQLYDYIAENIGSLNYVAICAGSETANLEIGEQLQTFLLRHGCTAPILMCTGKGVYHQSPDDHITSHRIYTPEILCSDRIDRMAMVLNQSYAGRGDIRENWKNCGYFDRMSSRAAADFHDALLYCAGITADEAMENWNPEGELLENLAASEHLRWNAFHYCMGFRPMTEEEYQQRADAYPDEIKKDASYRITKDVDKRIHACLIPWEALDAYSAKENAVTGGHRDYAENDRNNVRNLGKLLRAMKDAE